MVQVYSNLDGLARKLYSVGIIKSVTDLHEFSRSFSLNQPLFSFVDVGSGKERADHKIRGKLLWLYYYGIATSHCSKPQSQSGLHW